MNFEPLFVEVGYVAGTEYSLHDCDDDRWLTVGADGGVRFDSPTPVSLRTYFPVADAGTENFARRLLAWVREHAGTGEILDNRWADCDAEQASRVAVFSFDGLEPLIIETDLEFNTDFNSKDVIFEVRGEPYDVDEYVREYLNHFPPHTYRTQVVPQVITDDSKTLRVVRERLFD
jgi:hypothetical protein